LLGKETNVEHGEENVQAQAGVHRWVDQILLKEFGVVNNMFKQNMKLNKVKKWQKLINEMQKKNKAKQKKTMECAFMPKVMGCFFSFHLKVNMVEDLILFGIEDHTIEPTNVREHFVGEELTLGNNRLLEVASLVVWEWIELIGIFIKMIWKRFFVIRVHEFAYW